MAAVSAELDAAVAAAEQDDGASWWARTDAGEWYPSRILGFNQKSPTLRDLLRSDRFALDRHASPTTASCSATPTSATAPRAC